MNNKKTIMMEYKKDNNGYHANENIYEHKYIQTNHYNDNNKSVNNIHNSPFKNIICIVVIIRYLLWNLYKNHINKIDMKKLFF